MIAQDAVIKGIGLLQAIKLVEAQASLTLSDR